MPPDPPCGLGDGACVTIGAIVGGAIVSHGPMPPDTPCGLGGGACVTIGARVGGGIVSHGPMPPDPPRRLGDGAGVSNGAVPDIPPVISGTLGGGATVVYCMPR